MWLVTTSAYFYKICMSISCDMYNLVVEGNVSDIIRSIYVCVFVYVLSYIKNHMYMESKEIIGY